MTKKNKGCPSTHLKEGMPVQEFIGLKHLWGERWQKRASSRRGQGSTSGRGEGAMAALQALQQGTGLLYDVGVGGGSTRELYLLIAACPGSGTVC